MIFADYIDLLPQEIHETVQNIHTELTAMGFTEEIKDNIFMTIPFYGYFVP